MSSTPTRRYFTDILLRQRHTLAVRQHGGAARAMSGAAPMPRCRSCSLHAAATTTPLAPALRV